MKAVNLMMIFLLLSCESKDNYELNKISKIFNTTSVQAVRKCSYESFSSFNGDGLGAYTFELDTSFLKGFQQKLASKQVVPQSDRDMHYWKAYPWKKSVETYQDSAVVDLVTQYILGVQEDKVCRMGMDTPININEDMVYAYIIKGDAERYLDGVELYVLDFKQNLFYVFEAYM